MLFERFESSSEEVRLGLWRAVEAERRRRSPAAQDDERVREERAAAAMRLAMTADGSTEVLSFAGYAQVRREHPELGLLAGSTVKMLAGKWSRLGELLALHPPIDPRAADLRAFGPAFELGELRDAVVQAAGSLGEGEELTSGRYKEWAAARRREDPAVRLPTSIDPFGRHGGFAAVRDEALAQAGLGQHARSAVRDDRELLVELIKAAAADLGRDRLHFYEFSEWARKESAEGSGRFRRVAVSRPTFLAAFGDWGRACQAAGIKPGGQADGEAWSARGSSDAYTDERLLARLREVAGHEARSSDPPRITPGYVRPDRFTQLQRELCASARRDGRHYQPVAMKTFAKRFGSWANACRAAGLIDEQERRRLNRFGNRPISDQRIREVLFVAAEELGRDFGPAQYDRWATQQVQAGDHEARFPHSTTVAARLGGSFKVAVRRLIAEGATAESHARDAANPRAAAGEGG